VTRSLDVQPNFNLPQGWEAILVVVTPAAVKLTGPEVWLSTLNKIETAAIRLDQASGLFDITTSLVPLSGKGIHVQGSDGSVRVRGELVLKKAQQPEPVNIEEVTRAQTQSTAVTGETTAAQSNADASENGAFNAEVPPYVEPLDTYAEDMPNASAADDQQGENDTEEAEVEASWSSSDAAAEPRAEGVLPAQDLYANPATQVQE